MNSAVQQQSILSIIFWVFLTSTYLEQSGAGKRSSKGGGYVAINANKILLSVVLVHQ